MLHGGTEFANPSRDKRVDDRLVHPTIRYLLGLSLAVGLLAIGYVAWAHITRQPGSSTSASTASESPGHVVSAYLAAQSRGDMDAAAALLADDAILEAAPPDICSAPNPCVGKSDIHTKLLRRIARGHPKLTPVDQVIAGDTVTTRVEVRNDGVRAAGFDRYIVSTVARISDDKIVNFVVVRDLTDPDTAAFNHLQTGR